MFKEIYGTAKYVPLVAKRLKTIIVKSLSKHRKLGSSKLKNFVNLFIYIQLIIKQMSSSRSLFMLLMHKQCTLHNVRVV